MTLALKSVTLNPSTVIGGGGDTAIVTFVSSPSQGAVVHLSSSNAAVAGFQENVLNGDEVVVPPGQTSATFAVVTTAVAAPTQVTITATSFGTTTATATLTVNPGTPPAADTVHHRAGPVAARHRDRPGDEHQPERHPQRLQRGGRGLRVRADQRGGRKVRGPAGRGQRAELPDHRGEQLRRLRHRNRDDLFLIWPPRLGRSAQDRGGGVSQQPLIRTLQRPAEHVAGSEQAVDAVVVGNDPGCQPCVDAVPQGADVLEMAADLA